MPFTWNSRRWRKRDRQTNIRPAHKRYKGSDDRQRDENVVDGEYSKSYINKIRRISRGEKHSSEERLDWMEPPIYSEYHEPRTALCLQYRMRTMRLQLTSVEAYTVQRTQHRLAVAASHSIPNILSRLRRMANGARACRIASKWTEKSFVKSPSRTHSRVTRRMLFIALRLVHSIRKRVIHSVAFRVYVVRMRDCNDRARSRWHAVQRIQRAASFRLARTTNNTLDVYRMEEM